MELKQGKGVTYRGVIAALLFVVLFAGLYLYRVEEPVTGVYQRNEGRVFGTLYHMIYEYPTDLKDSIEAELLRFDGSLSTFNERSVISRVNRNDRTVVLDEWFTTLFSKSLEVSRVTDGAFDFTVAPLVNLWGFGFKKREQVTPEKVDSILAFVGYDLVELQEGHVVKRDPRVMLDGSAIAKGYACDVIAAQLRRYGIQNFMVEIGGELVASGHNPKGELWRVGINKPLEDSEAIGGELEEVLALSNVAMATSGNYRNFYEEGGKKYAHTIDPKSGYPIQHNLLSATVVAPDCMTADAYATAFMVLGLERSMAIVEADALLEGYFIYTDSVGEYRTVASEGLKQYIRE